MERDQDERKHEGQAQELAPTIPNRRVEAFYEIRRDSGHGRWFHEGLGSLAPSRVSPQQALRVPVI